jgi:transcriptional regulator with XRE-family HTH domain
MAEDEGSRMDVPFLRRWRKALFYSLAELAERSGVDESTIRRIEKGKHRANMTTLRKLAAGLGITQRHLAYTDPGVGAKAAALAEEIQRQVRGEATHAEQHGKDA